jgi:hypothetical protein
MKKTLLAIAGAVVIGLASPVLAAEPTAAEQTSPEQVQLCEAGLQGCQAGHVNECTIALKTCVGEQRQQAMKLMEAS